MLINKKIWKFMINKYLLSLLMLFIITSTLYSQSSSTFTDTSQTTNNMTKPYFAIGVLAGLPGLLYGTLGIHSDYTAIRINIGLGYAFDFKTVFNFYRTPKSKHGIFFNVGIFNESETDNYYWFGIGYEYNRRGFHISPGFIGYTTGIPFVEHFKPGFAFSPQFQIGYIFELKR